MRKPTITGEVAAMWVMLAIGLAPGVHALLVGDRLGVESSIGLLIAIFAASQLLRRTRS